MQKSARIYNNALSTLRRYLKAHSKRPSPVRNTVLELAFQLQQPFTAEQLAEVCKVERISLATVYNSLNLFLDAGILRATERQRGRAALEYELVTGSPVHMEVVCTKCGRVTEFHDKAISRLIQERRYWNFKATQLSLRVYGECKVCRSNAPKPNNA